MEIIPGLGVDLVKIGDRRSQVEEGIGPPYHGPGGLRAVHATSPMLVITYAADETVELVEIRCSGVGSDTEVHYDAVQLTHRFLDDVVADLHALGYTSTPSDIGHDFHAGFSVWPAGRSATPVSQRGPVPTVPEARSRTSELSHASSSSPDDGDAHNVRPSGLNARLL